MHTKYIRFWWRDVIDKHKGVQIKNAIKVAWENQPREIIVVGGVGGDCSGMKLKPRRRERKGSSVGWLTRLLWKVVTYSRRLITVWQQMHWLMMNCKIAWLLLLQQPFEPHYSVGQFCRSVAAPMWWIWCTGATANAAVNWLIDRPGLESRSNSNCSASFQCRRNVELSNASNNAMHLPYWQITFFSYFAHTHTNSVESLFLALLWLFSFKQPIN